MSKKKKRKAYPLKSRRGRPPKPMNDGPTPELLAKRIALVGDGKDPRGGYPLGVLWAQGLITQDMHDAGVYYGYLAGRILGKVHPGPASGGVYDQFKDDEAQEIIEPLWRDACQVLMGVSRRAKDMVDNCAVHLREPGFLYRDMRDGDAQLFAGLHALAEWRVRGRLKVA